MLHQVAVKKSAHASVRAQQRGIPPLIIDWLLTFGEEEPDRDGSTIVYFNKHSRQLIGKEAGEAVVRQLERFLDAYAVLSHDGAIVTCGHRTKRINRH